MKNLFVTLLFISTSFTALAKFEPLTEAFGSLPDVKNMLISPDGRKLAFMQNNKDSYVIVVQDLEDQNAQPFFFSIDEGQIEGLRWLNDKRLTFYVYAPAYNGVARRWFTYFSSALLNADTGEVIFPFAESRLVQDVRSMSVLHTLPLEPDFVLITTAYRSGLDGSYEESLLRLNVMNGKAEKIYEAQSPDGNSVSWILGDNGDFHGYQIYQSNKNSWSTFLKNSENDEFSEYTENASNESNLPKIYSYNDQFAYVKTLSDTGVTGMGKVPAKRLLSKPIEPKTFGQFDLHEGYIQDLHTGKLVGISAIRDWLEFDYFADAELQTIYRSLQATFGKTEINILSYTKDRRLFTIRIDGGEYIPTYFLYDHKAKQISLLGSEYSEKVSQYLGNTKSFDITASDGLTIPGYLTLPNNIESPPELIVYPHGGPSSRDTANFDWIRDFFVANGFAVYQPNFRGSTGYGLNFKKAGFGQWGRRMQLDVYEGTRAVLKSGHVASKKPCILGHSYGGYVAMMAAVESKELFRCAVSSAGVSSIQHLVLLESIDNQRNRNWDEKLFAQEFFAGDATKSNLASISPLSHVSTNTLPLLLMHGKMDTVVRYKHSENMYARMKDAGNENVFLLTAPGADHWFNEAETRKVLLSDSLYFIRQN